MSAFPPSTSIRNAWALVRRNGDTRPTVEQVKAAKKRLPIAKLESAP